MGSSLLIIDDEKLVCNNIRAMLPWKEYGFINVMCASDSKKAIEIIDRYAPDMIITDISMPDKSGLEIIEYVRNQKMNAYVILISAYDEFEYAQKAIDLGVQAYILKPVSPEILKNKVELYLLPDTSRKEAIPSCGMDKRKQLKMTIDEYFQTNLHEKITLEETAQTFYFSSPYFSQLFSQLYGITFTDYINKLKTEKASHYLKYSQYKITYIADMLGFKDYRYFIRIFKKHYGYSPLQYRKNHIQTIE